jgi:hypothetical protein
VLQIPLQGKLFVPVYVFAGALIYLAGLRVLHVIRQEDIELLRSYFGRRLAFVASILGRILM